MRFSTVDEDVARIALPDEAATARKVQESVAIHAALGPVAIEARLKEIERELAAQQAGREPHPALLLGALGQDGPTPRRRYLLSMAGAGLLAWLAAPGWADAFCPPRSRRLHLMHEVHQEREALSRLRHELT
jgi:hypothetical protein